MNLTLPEGAHVQIVVSPTAPSSINAPPPALALPAPTEPPRRRIHPLLKGAGVLALGVLAYVAGERSAPRTAPVQQARAQVPLSAAPSAAPAQLPPAVREQLQMPPTITPPPGTPAAGRTGESAFGLEE
jgi:hypothetical protein